MSATEEGAARLMDAVCFDIVHHTRGTGIELARGRWRSFPHFVSVRERGDTTMPPGLPADVWVDSFARLDDVVDGRLDFVFACDIEVTEEILRAAASKLRRGGHLVIATGTPESPALEFFEASGDGLLERLPDPLARPRELAAAAGKKAAGVVRYGGIGDALMSDPILRRLHEEGYRVTLLCDPSVAHILRACPFVDDVLVQDRDQVPNGLLLAYWDRMSQRFDRFVNLSGVIEETLIALPGRSLHRLSHAARHELCNRNYVEFQALASDVAYDPAYRFHAEPGEQERAEKTIAAMGDALNGKQWVIGEQWKRPFVVMWALSGSGFHKAYPHTDGVIARALLETPDACFLLVGDNSCKILEVGWENEPRVKCLSGELDIRDTLALAQRCDLVIGPETGVMNAVAFESMPKIIFLSHSSVENLTRDWENTESLEADVSCHPCHQNHADRSTCRINVESNAAACMHDIAPSSVWEAFQRAYTARRTVSRILEAA